MSEHPELPKAIEAAQALSASLLNPTLLVTLHRDIEGHTGQDGRSLGRSAKQYALRWGIFTMAYASVEAFFSDLLLTPSSHYLALTLSPDKLRSEGEKHHVKLFTNDWGVRTQVTGPHAGNRPRWKPYVGTQALRDYLADMRSLRNLLSHGGDAQLASNSSGALWPLANGGHTMRIMGVEGFIQACTDLAAQAVLAYGGQLDQIPNWPEPRRSGLSAERRPSLPLIP